VNALCTRLAVLALSLVVLAGCRKEHAWSVADADPATLRTVAGGQVVGGQGRYGSLAWLGIPFAAPPTGDLRWRAPRLPEPWTGTRQALRFAPACPQFGGPLTPGKQEGVTGSEDCLYLNVWAPPGAQKLPVMVWIHGGGNSLGSAEPYEAGHLATSQNVVVVTTQYRLGPLGWLRHKALRSDATDSLEASGNFATLDLIRTLQWVRDDIAAFGGDPDNVTIFGESAGGTNVFTLLVSPPARGLFQRAIVQSGVLSNTTPDQAERFTDDATAGHRNSSGEVLARLLQADGKAGNRGDAKARIAAMADAEVAAFLRSRSVDQVLAEYADGRIAGMLDMPTVIHDGALLPTGEFVDALAQPDGWARVPTIVGTNRDEMKLFLMFRKEFVRWTFGLIPRFVDSQRYDVASEYLSRTWKVASADQPATAMRRSGATEVYLYRFDWDEEPTVAGADLSKLVGAAHAIEIPFVFGHFDLGPAGKNLFPQATAASRGRLSDSMMAYWANFARTGSPGRGPGDQPEWTAWDPSPSPRFMVFAPQARGGPNLATGADTIQKVIADIDADPRIAAQVDRCRLFHSMAGWTQALTRESYPRAGRDGCAGFPFDDFPR
jgi:para-nitrobenzyl esterase